MMPAGVNALWIGNLVHVHWATVGSTQSIEMIMLINMQCQFAVNAVILAFIALANIFSYDAESNTNEVRG